MSPLLRSMSLVTKIRATLHPGTFYFHGSAPLREDISRGVRGQSSV